MTEVHATLARAFGAAGHQVFLVGGVVRDGLLGRENKDLDFATDAPVERSREILEGVATHLFTPGIAFGTIDAIIAGEDVQVTTFRADAYRDGSRHPSVVFENITIEGDLARRDLTINAMALACTAAGVGDLIDPFGGQRDLQDRLIRAVGDPVARFSEDPLRLLRAVRFAVRFDFSIEAGTGAALRTCAHLLASISGERLRAELEKILLSEAPDRGIALLAEFGVLPHILPAPLAQVALGSLPRDLVLRLAALLSGQPLPAVRRTLGALRFDLATTGAVVTIVSQVAVARAGIAPTIGARRRFILACHGHVDSVLTLAGDDAALRAELAAGDPATWGSPLDGGAILQIAGRAPGAWVGLAKAHLATLVQDGVLACGDTAGAAAALRAHLGT